MPLVAYSVKIGEDILVEKDYLPRGSNVTKEITERVINPWNKRREQTNEALAELIDVKIENPWVHEHLWVKGQTNKFACKQHYRCSNCGVTGYKKLHLFNGEGCCITRDEDFQRDKFALCRDQLKTMPKSTQLTFR